MESIHIPKCHHLFPPLHYVVDLDDLLPSHFPCPAEFIVDNPNIISERREKIFLFQSFLICTDILVRIPVISIPSTQCTAISMSPPCPPFFPTSMPKDLINPHIKDFINFPPRRPSHISDINPSDIMSLKRALRSPSIPKSPPRVVHSDFRIGGTCFKKGYLLNKTIE